MAITHIYSVGKYRSEVQDNNYVKIFCDDTLIDNPGPWGDHEGARSWAETIVGKLHAESLTQNTP